MLKKRLLTGFGLLPLPVAAAWFGGPWFTALVAVFGALAFVEFYRLRGNSGLAPLGYLGAALAVVFIVSRDARLLGGIDPQVDTALVPSFVLAGAVGLTLLLAGARRRSDGGIAGWAWTMAGVLYLGWFLSHWVALMGLPDGRNWVFLGLLATFASDTAAFFVGRALGRHPLAPTISPNKTWEGAAGGLIGAVALCLVFVAPRFLGLNNALFIEGLGPWWAVGIGIMVSVFGQLGDLTESWLKRKAGVKDAGGLFPGHGGALDRVDSVLFAGVVLYYYVSLSGAT